MTTTATRVDCCVAAATRANVCEKEEPREKRKEESKRDVCVGKEKRVGQSEIS